MPHVNNKISGNEAPESANAHVPYLPPISPYVLPSSPLNRLLENYGVRLQWQKAHQCACVFGGDMPGSADPLCTSCHGRGVYWEAPSAIFSGLITFSTTVPSHNEPGASLDVSAGPVFKANPLLTIPETAGTVYIEASLYDSFIEVDNIQKFTTNLIAGGNGALPYQLNCKVNPSGAVTVYNNTTKTVEVVTGYTVDYSNGVTVLLPDTYPVNTSYTVDFYASPSYIAFGGAGGMAHTRPFGNGNTTLPKRFQLMLMDVWTRSSNAGSFSTSSQA